MPWKKYRIIVTYVYDGNIKIKAMELLEVKQQTFDRQLFSFDSISLISFLNEIEEVQKSCKIQSVLFISY